MRPGCRKVTTSHSARRSRSSGLRSTFWVCSRATEPFLGESATGEEAIERYAARLVLQFFLRA